MPKINGMFAGCRYNKNMGNDLKTLVLRVSFGSLMFFGHGLSKLEAYKIMSLTFPDPLGVGHDLSLALVIFAEVVCALFIALGFFTRLSAVPLVITMIVGVFIIHGGDPWAKKELAVIYLVGFTLIFFSGGGKYSLQKLFKISSNSRIPLVSWLLN